MSGPKPLPKMLFEEDYARRLEQERDAAAFAEGRDVPEIVVNGRRPSGEPVKSGKGFLERIDDLFDTNLSGMNPHRTSAARQGPSDQGPVDWKMAHYDLGPAPGLAETYSYGGRSYPSFEAAQAAHPDMPLIGNPPGAASEYAARRDKAFLDSIGSGALGLGPMSYVMGGSPETIQASTQFDEALGGLMAGTAMRPSIRQRFESFVDKRPVESFLRYRWPPLANRLSSSRGDLPVGRGEYGVQDIATASRELGHEVGYFRNRATQQRYLRDLGPQMGEVPFNSRLILHTHPGETHISVKPSDSDRIALDNLGQRSSVIVNERGDKAIRYHRNPRDDGRIGEYRYGTWRFK
ncbi:hypothetical protein Swit_4447 [Rhizorhabdus wittichii RW1]|uniref:Uncharacterized protein n=1 Tax=Rhizorhabdus wittichii (strain DSM 6014 / CCUG 31198 / JCM 15750 / NBRC 105917 / EY 4224 / RW1) TaxID=392499 RepID=A0A9J9HFC5_RHIWR|nr:hypothetical protein Swit_4447 [Rhizorhabdus wittichii RW1]